MKFLLYNFLRQLFDIIFCICALSLFLHLFLLISLCIKLDSSGPIIFKHKRIGKNGKEFTIYKFRTLFKDTDPYMFKLSESDFCITNFGRFIRKTALDELPQLFNVIKGDMSLVGPRPEMPFIVETYGPVEKKRLSVKPGITGLWQINRPGDNPIHADLGYDLDYIKNKSIFLDLQIILKTIYIPFFYIRDRFLLAFYHSLIFFLYYAGIITIVRFIRRKILKRFRLIVLLYHHIDDYKKDDFSMPLKIFDKQMKYLRKKYTVISMEEMFKIKSNNVDRDYIVITFDDGYKDAILNAYPILEKYDLKATLFLTYEYIERGKRGLRNECLNWQDLERLKNRFAFGSHTISHPDLTILDADKIYDEVNFSKKNLEEKLSYPVKYFAYPYGRFNLRVQNMVKEAGYSCAFSTIDGTNNFKDDFCLKRKEIRNRPFSSFVAKLEGLTEIPFFAYLK